MADVRQGRWTAKIDGDFVVFLIGTKIDVRHPLRSFRDVGGNRGMVHMLRYLSAHPEKGLLGFDAYGLTTLVQYWRSYEHLERFASNQDDPHLAVWRRYWKRVGTSARTGIWHETYLVRAGEYEAIYGNMPAFGLAGATSHVPVGRRGQSAARRLGVTTADETAVDPY